MTENSSFFPKNVFGAFGILFFISGAIIPLQNLIIWGPEFVAGYFTSSDITAEGYFTSSDITAEKLSLVVIGIGVFIIIYGKKKQNQI